MILEPIHSDQAILEEIGHRLARRRLAINLTQSDLADRAGISKRTVERIEAGESAQLSSWIRLLRVLGLIDGLEALVPEPAPSPMAQLRLRGKERQRARKRKGIRYVADVSPAPRLNDGEPAWTWGEDP